MKRNDSVENGAPATAGEGDRALLWQWLAIFFAPERRAWRGAAPLGRVFWGYGVCVSAILAALYAAAVIGERPELQQRLIAVFAAYTVWILVSVWRCAAHADPAWGVPARWLTVAWAGNASLVLFFLELDLISRQMLH